MLLQPAAGIRFTNYENMTVGEVFLFIQEMLKKHSKSY